MELDGEDVLRIKPVDRLPAHRHGEDGRRAHLRAGRAPTSRAWTTRRRSRTSSCTRMAVERLLDVEVPPRAHVDPHDDVRAQPHGVAPAVPGDERHGHRRGVDDALRLARARRGAAALRVRHRPADEPQLHPARRRRRRPARRLAGATRSSVCDIVESGRRRVRRAARRRTRSGASARSASASSPPRSASRAASPARSCARPASPGTCARRSRTSPYDEVDFDVIYTQNGDVFDRYRIRLSGDPRVGEDRAPVRGEDAARATTACRTRRSRRRRARASTSRWKR